MRSGYGEETPKHTEAVSLTELLTILERHRRWIVLGLAVVFVPAMTWIGTSRPSFEATATLMLESDGPSSGVLSELAALSSAPAAEAEMAVLRSRTLAESTVAPPASWRPASDVFEPTPADSFLVTEEVRLGTQTVVFPEDRRPFAQLLAGGGEHRLRALVSGVSGAEEWSGPVRVRFPDARTVLVSSPGPLGIGNREEVTQTFEPEQVADAGGIEVTYRGALVRLSPSGDYVGRSYLVATRSLARAVEDLKAHTSVSETQRNSNVIKLTTSASDPYVAAELANALCQNYVLRSIEIRGQRATRTATFLDSQLEEQLELLRAAEEEVVELQARHPEAIQISATAESVIESLRELEAERTRVQLTRVALEEAADHIDRGDRRALARLGQELPDLVSRSQIEAIGRLTSEAFVLDRTDGSVYKAMLQSEVEGLRLARERSIRLQERLESVLSDLGRGDYGAVSQLESGGQSGQVLDPMTTQYLAEIAKLDVEASRLAETLTDEHPALAEVIRSKRDLEEKVRVQLENALAGVRLAIGDHDAMLGTYAELLEAWPRRERAEIEGAVASLVREVRANIANQLGGLATRERALDGELERLEKRLGAVPDSERILAEPIRRRETLTQIVQVLMESQQQARVSQAATLPCAVLIDPAIPPARPSWPHLPFATLAALLFGLAAGLGFALVRHAFSRSIFTQAELEARTGLTVFGAIPDFRFGGFRVRGAGKRFVPVRDDPRGLVAESFRSLREKLRFASGTQKLRSIAVTSSTPGEGKSTTNVDLALSFARSGRRVLLVDGDLRRPTIHRYLDLPLGPGLAACLQHGRDWHELRHANVFENLDVLTAGAATNDSGELLATGRASEMLEEFMSEYDLVVCDLPPVHGIADVDAFAHHLDAILLLYRAGGVPGDVLVAATQRLERAGAKLVGTILNAVRPERRGESAYYYSAYGYGDKHVDGEAA